MPSSAVPNRAAIISAISDKVSIKTGVNNSAIDTQTAQKLAKQNAGATRLVR